MRRRSTVSGGVVMGVVAVVVALGVLPPTPTSAAEAWLRPVPGPVAHPFAAPLTRFGRGHLGVDFAAEPGTPVRAAGSGTVVFAGLVAGARHVVVRHAGGLRTSYSFLASVRVRPGEAVGRGTVLGTAGGRGEKHEAGVVHFGLRIGVAYVDPMRLFAPPDLSARVHLAPDGAEGTEGRAPTVAPRRHPAPEPDVPVLRTLIRPG